MAEFGVFLHAEAVGAYGLLPRSIQKKTTDLMGRLSSVARNSRSDKGVNLEQVKGSKGGCLYTARIDGSYRAVVAFDSIGQNYVIVNMGKHEAMYDWAENRSYEVNPITAVPQLYKVEEPVEAADTDGWLFSLYSDEQLLQLGLPSAQLEQVRAMNLIEDLEDSSDVIPEDVWEALMFLAGGSEYDEVLALYREMARPSRVASFDGVMESPQAKRSVIGFSNEDDLTRALALSLEKWRLFLHPSQQELVEEDFDGPVKVIGGAGTGKTVVAMHRAKRLAAELIEKNGADAAASEILFTMFSTSLAYDVQSMLGSACTADEMQCIEVVNINAWLSNFINHNEIDFRVEYDDRKIDKIWERAIRDSGAGNRFFPAFCREEYSQVIMAHGIESLVEYQRTSREDRAVALSKTARSTMWKVVESYRALLKKRHVRDADTAYAEIESKYNWWSGEPYYQHVIIDEAQDISAPAYRLLRALAGTVHTNDMFITGDSRQRIFGQSAALSECGIDVQNRRRTLKINYRTSEENRLAALRVVEGITFDDLDNGIDVDDEALSLQHGNPPIVEGFDTIDEEDLAIAATIEAFRDLGKEDRDICVVTRQVRHAGGYMSGLEKLGIPVYDLQRARVDDRSVGGVRVCSMHRAKGLEFDCVIIANASDGALPPASVINACESEEERNNVLKSDRCLLYVAITRARDAVYITYRHEPSDLLGDVVVYDGEQISLFE